MAAGADVTHPMGFNKVIPSIASVVASLNRHATHYCERSRLQAHRTEIIQVGGHCFPGLCSCASYACKSRPRLQAHRASRRCCR